VPFTGLDHPTGVAADSDGAIYVAGDVATGLVVAHRITVENGENLAFAARQGVQALIEEDGLNNAPAAFARMLDGKARFRIVLVP
jgi:D-arabinose 1-dehydrogenase-like Zn-dependent alcohol dehydrogenase